MKTFVRLTYFLKSFYLGILIVISVFSFSSCGKENYACCIIYSPSDGAQFEKGREMYIKVETRDEDGIGLSNVNIYIDDSIIYTANKKQIYHDLFMSITENATTGKHEIKAVAKTPKGTEMTKSKFIEFY